jgi:hypothetical protein
MWKYYGERRQNTESVNNNYYLVDESRVLELIEFFDKLSTTNIWYVMNYDPMSFTAVFITNINAVGTSYVLLLSINLLRVIKLKKCVITIHL